MSSYTVRFYGHTKTRARRARRKRVLKRRFTCLEERTVQLVFRGRLRDIEVGPDRRCEELFLYGEDCVTIFGLTTAAICAGWAWPDE